MKKQDLKNFLFSFGKIYKVDIVFSELSVTAVYDQQENRILINNRLNKKYLDSILVHELSHVWLTFTVKNKLLNANLFESEIFAYILENFMDSSQDDFGKIHIINGMLQFMKDLNLYETYYEKKYKSSKNLNKILDYFIKQVEDNHA